MMMAISVMMTMDNDVMELSKRMTNIMTMEDNDDGNDDDDDNDENDYDDDEK